MPTIEDIYLRAIDAHERTMNRLLRIDEVKNIVSELWAELFSLYEKDSIEWRMLDKVRREHADWWSVPTTSNYGKDMEANNLNVIIQVIKKITGKDKPSISSNISTNNLNKRKIEALALSSLISIAFSIVLSFDFIVFNKVPIILLVWAVICGIVLGHQEIKSFRVNYKLAIMPSVILVLAPPIAALMRALLAMAAGVSPDVQSFLGYSVFNPGWYLQKPGIVAGVVISAFLVSSILLTIGNLAGSVALSYMSRAYSAGPEAFERIEKIAKRLVSILSIIGVFWFLSE